MLKLMTLIQVLSKHLNRLPERIACLYAFTGHVVTMLGRGEDMAAIVNGLKKDVLLNYGGADDHH